MNKKDRTKVYFKFLKARTALAKKKIDLSGYQPEQPEETKEKHSQKAKDIVTAIRNGDFGCKSASVHKLMSAATGIELPPLKETEQAQDDLFFDVAIFIEVPWACFSAENPYRKEIYCIIGEGINNCLTAILNGDGLTNMETMDEAYFSIDFASDKDIKSFLNDEHAFTAIDSILRFMTE